jgi:hypothetical protein
MVGSPATLLELCVLLTVALLLSQYQYGVAGFSLSSSGSNFLNGRLGHQELHRRLGSVCGGRERITSKGVRAINSFVRSSTTSSLSRGPEETVEAPPVPAQITFDDSYSMTDVVSQLQAEVSDVADSSQSEHLANMGKIQHSLQQLLKFARSYDENKFYRKFIYSMVRYLFARCYQHLSAVDPLYSPAHGIHTFSQAIRKAKKFRDMSVIARSFRHVVSNLPNGEAGFLLANCISFAEAYAPEALDDGDFHDLSKRDILRQFRLSTATIATKENISLLERLVRWFDETGHF